MSFTPQSLKSKSKATQEVIKAKWATHEKLFSGFFLSVSIWVTSCMVDLGHLMIICSHFPSLLSTHRAKNQWCPFELITIFQLFICISFALHRPESLLRPDSHKHGALEIDWAVPPRILAHLPRMDLPRTKKRMMRQLWSYLHHQPGG